MKKYFVIVMVIIILLGVLFMIYKNKDSENEIVNTGEVAKDEVSDMILLVNNKKLVVKLENNSSTRAFLGKLRENDIVVEAKDYGGFEKVGELEVSFPTNDKEITTKPGDLILYQGDKISLYYDTNTYSFTKLGHIKDITKDELIKILGDGNVTMTFKLKE